MPGEIYTQTELMAMSPEDFAAAKANNFTRPFTTGPNYTPGFQQASASEFGGLSVTGIAAAAAQPSTQINLGSSMPRPTATPRDDVWASHTSTADAYDFVCPSGQKCRLRKLQPEQLLQEGLLDKVTRLEGLAQTLVDQAEGQPPALSKLPSKEDLALLLETINLLVPLAVVQPKIWADDAEIPEGTEVAIRCNQIDLGDRMAIMEEALKGIRKLDAFRQLR